MPTVPKVRHHAIHANPIFKPTVPRHIRPIPLERHGHLPQILRHVVERLVELAHGDRVEVVDAIDVDRCRVGEVAGPWCVLVGDGRGSELLLGHLRVGLERGVGEVGGEGEGLGRLVRIHILRAGCAYLVKAMEVGVENHAWRCVVLWRRGCCSW